MKRKTFYSALILHFILQAHLSFGQSGYCNFSDWTALKALYESTDGDNWTFNSGWDLIKTNEPPEDCDLETMYGVTLGGECFVDDEGVTECFYPLGVFDIFLNGNNLNGTIPPEIGNMFYLKYLGLETNNLTGSLPKEMAKLNNLIYLSTSNNRLSGCYDNEIKKLCGQLSGNDNFRFISEGNNFDTSWEDFCNTGAGTCIPQQQSCRQTDSLALIEIYKSLNADNLVDFSQPIDKWFGITLNENGCVDKIELNSSNLEGEVPSKIGDLSEITILSLSNNNITGSLPSEIGNLSQLTLLNASINQITYIPETIGELSNLSLLFLAFNNLVEIPATIGSLNLSYLSVNDNAIAGSLPVWLTEMEQLSNLLIQNNQLSGCYSEELKPFCSQLAKFYNVNAYISEGNNFDATWEDFCTTGAGSCSPQPPQTCRQADSLVLAKIYESFYLYDIWDISKPIDTWQGVYLNENGCVQKLEIFDSGYYFPYYGGYGGYYGGYTYGYYFSELPPEIKNLQEIEEINLSGNLLRSVPPEIGDLSTLKRLSITGNPITELPETIGNLYNLEFLDISFNSLFDLPNSIGNLTNLQFLSIERNYISGELPAWLDELEQLTALNISNNRFSGCYSFEMKNLCDQLSDTFNQNAYISDGNNFDISWEDFCATGTCTPSCRQTDSLTLIKVFTSLGIQFENDLPIDAWSGVLLNDNGCVESFRIKENFGITGTIPPAIGNLSEVKHLSINETNITGIPPEIGNLTKLETLRLSENNIQGPLPSTIGNLSNLQYLDLSANSITEIPFSIGNLTNLTNLELNNNKLTEIPAAIGVLYNLTYLSFNENQITGTLPGWLADLDNLSFLNAGDNQMTGCYVNAMKQLCDGGFIISNGNNFDATWEDFCSTGKGTCTIASIPNCHIDDWTALKALHKSARGYNWVSRRGGWDEIIADQNIPPANCDLSKLSNIYLNESGRVNLVLLSSQNLQGNIPPEIGLLSELEKLSLSFNSITGFIPREIEQLKNLNLLALGDNQLTGNIPSGIGNLTNLTVLRLDENILEGIIPAELGNLQKLNILFLSENKLSGQLPPELGNLQKLESLVLYDNQLSGQIPAELSNMENLSSLVLAYNQLSGCYESELKQLCNQVSPTFPISIDGYAEFTEAISLGNNFDASWEDFCATGAGICNTSLPNCRQTDSLALIEIYKSLNAEHLVDFSQPINNWYGVALNENGCVDALMLFDSNLEGKLSEEIGSLSEITYLDVGFNNIAYIPETINKLSNLQAFLIDNNNLVELPASIESLNNLYYLWVNDNQISGPLPAWLTKIEQLADLKIQNNQLSGCYEDELKQLCTNLLNSSIISDGNNFDASWEDFCATGAGSCSPQTNCRQKDSIALTSIFESLKLSYEFDFSKPTTQWPGVTLNENGCVDKLDLSGKGITGVIPAAIGDLGEITFIKMVENNITGSIPTEIGNLETLQILSLGDNNLVGSVPESIGKLINLEGLYLSANQFTQIPASIGELTKLEKLYLGNNQLTELPETLVDLSELTHLYVNDNQLAGELPVWISDLDRLAYFQIQNNQLIGCYEDGFSKLCKQLNNYYNKNIYISNGNYFNTSWENFCRGSECLNFRNPLNPEDQSYYSYNQPNPFTNQTSINYTLNSTSKVTINVYDSLGRNVASLRKNETQDAGNHSVIFSGDNMPAGIYYYSIESHNFKEMKKMMLIK